MMYRAPSLVEIESRDLLSQQLFQQTLTTVSWETVLPLRLMSTSKFLGSLFGLICKLMTSVAKMLSN